MKRNARCATLASILAVFVSFGFAHSAWAQIDAYNTMVNNGDSSNRVDMIFIGDGYQASEIESTYVDHINGTLNHFFDNGSISSPLDRYNKFFNVHRVNVVSNQSGADKPLDNIFVDTALDASYSWNGSVERCLYFDTGLANDAVATALAGTGIDTNDGMLLGAVNDTKYGGCGGQWGVYSAGNGAANEVALHEIGHSFARLADEYFSDGTYSGGEFSQWNVTNNPGSGKWDRWVGYDDPNSDIGVIGYYEGGHYNSDGVWRPSDNSKMRSLNRPFDAISREKFINDIYVEVDPLDGWAENSVGELSELWVSTVDSDVINVEWFVDGVSYGVLGEMIDVNSFGLAPGDYEFTARAYDSILDHAFTGDGLDWWRLDGSALEQFVSWNITISAVPEPGSAFLVGLLLIGQGLRRRRS